MLPAGLAPFRQLSRPGDQAVVAGDPAQCVQGGVRAAKRVPASPEGKDDEQVEDPPAIWQGPQPSPEVELLQRSDGQKIRRLVAELPQPFREAVVLRDINNLSYREIAEVAGIPLGTVMSRLARARSMLRAAWNGEEGSTT